MPPVREQSLLKSIGELIDLATRYVKEQAGATVEDHIARPIRGAARWAAFTLVGAVLFCLAAIFFSVGFFLLLAKALGSVWGAFLCVGAVLLLSGAVLVKLRSVGGEDGG